MTWSLLVSETLFTIIIAVDFLVAVEFYRSHDEGTLRKLMFTYFSIDVYVYLLGSLYVAGYIHMPDGLFRFIVLAPKAAVELRLFLYLRSQKKKEKD